MTIEMNADRGEGRKKTPKESKLLNAYSHNHWHFSLMRPD